MNLENLNSVQLIDELISVLREVWRRHDERGDVFVAQNGMVSMRYCPDCGYPIELYCAAINFTDEELSVLRKDWDKVIQEEHFIPHGWQFAHVPCARGRWYTAYCSCHAQDKWFPTYEEAVNFYLETFHEISLVRIFNPRREASDGHQPS